MKFTEIINNPILKKGLGIATAIVTGIVAVHGVLEDQKREKEFEDMKQDVADLKSKL